MAQRFLKTRSFLEGNPDVIIRNGIIDQKVMKKNMLDINTPAGDVAAEGCFYYAGCGVCHPGGQWHPQCPENRLPSQ